MFFSEIFFYHDISFRCEPKAAGGGLQPKREKTAFNDDVI
jgi:hypothetical protein